MDAIDNFNGLAFFLHSRMAENFFRHTWTYIKICHVYLEREKESSGNKFSIKSKMIILHATTTEWTCYSHDGEGKCNISIPFLTTIYDHRQSASLYFIFLREHYTFASLFMTFDSKNYWLHDKLSAFIVIYYVPKIAWDGGSWHSCCHVRTAALSDTFYYFFER